ncbi:hypothetical protein GCM10011391_38690 [Pullulanibacillus camelliae]|uniref:Uncharacterized protein n=1 Tax=Pullulanibacillus camelliae TaxID=1707096 RepID=A0A8J2YNM9_9BACL|nr:hypothetical protein GCM10011391_38690 [Pullulanibacillus camelliae]
MEWQAREIRSTLESCGPESPLTHDMILAFCGKGKIGTTRAGVYSEENPT